ncbi:hypothetical protein, partial [Chromobacterium piscinae]|uniref:hypothetical protein n=1 Tax=Chromobacterium piscinae TaxID=686831 RepID=UPI003260704F
LLQCKCSAFAKHLHLSVIRSVKEQCWPLRRLHRNRFVSAVSFAASAEETNYTCALTLGQQVF